MNGTDDKRTAGGKLRWNLEMELLLIDVWQEHIDELRGARKNSHIYMDMAQSMTESGHEVTWKDVRTKINNLTRKYREEKDKMGPSGGAPSSWQHFDSLHCFLGSSRVYTQEQDSLDNDNSAKYFEDSVVMDPGEEFTNSGTERSTSLPPAKRAKVDLKKELVKIARQRLEEQKTQTEILKRMAESQEEFQSEILKLLRESKK